MKAAEDNVDNIMMMPSLLLQTMEAQEAMDKGVTPPFLTGCGRRTHAAIFSFMAGVMPPIPILGRSLL